MTVQPKPTASVERKKPAEKKESIYGNVAGYRGAASNGNSNGVVSHGNSNGVVGNGSLRAKDRPSATAGKPAQDLFSTGRDSWLNMPKDLGPKLNRSKPTPAAHAKSRGRRETAGAASAGTADSDLSVLEQLNRAADEILKAVDGYTDDEQQPPQQQPQPQPQPQQQQQLKQRRRADDAAAAADTSSSSEAKLKNKKKAARLLQRANSREALLHLDGASSSDEDAVAPDSRVKPKTQRKTRQQHDSFGVAAKTTASFTKK